MQARYEILRSCLIEIQRVSIISSECCLPPPFQDLRPAFVASNGSLDGHGKMLDSEECFGPSQMAGEGLRHVAEACEVHCWSPKPVFFDTHTAAGRKRSLQGCLAAADWLDQYDLRFLVIKIYLHMSGHERSSIEKAALPGSHCRQLWTWHGSCSRHKLTGIPWCIAAGSNTRISRQEADAITEQYIICQYLDTSIL